jgi:hypothetical protein
VAKELLIEEFHLTWYVPRRLVDAECETVRRILNGTQFRRQLRRAVQDVIDQDPTLGKARFAITR